MWKCEDRPQDVARVVLVRPRNPGNIGACARAMSNFGFSNLVVVDPYGPIWEETRAAPDAEDVILSARKVATLKEALKGCRHVWGTSSFAHRTLEQAIIPLPQLSNALSLLKLKLPVAVVFGSERSGLSNDELAQCQAVIQIPMARRGISMNLAQAVAVVLYEWTRVSTKEKTPRAAATAIDSDVMEEWIRLAKVAGYPPGYTDAARAGRLRRALQGTTLGPEAARFFLSYTRWLSKTLQKRHA